MARKRMISPEIWESQNFSELNDLAKIVFISLFSHADDEGRGKAEPSFVKNTTFPYDDNRRVADIKSALSEIARSMSVQFYSVNGIEYYFMNHWERWQKIDKPSKSKLPPPPSVGEGGGMRSEEKFDEPSTKIRRTLDEPSTTNRIEKNRKEYPPTPQVGTGREEFLKEYPLLAKCKGYDDSEIDYALLLERFRNSKRLQDTYSMKWVCENYEAILNGLHADKSCNLVPTRAEWERWLSDRKYAAEIVADQARAEAESDERYAELKRKVIDLTLRSVKAAPAEAQSAEKELREVEAAKRKRLKELGIGEEALKPRYCCGDCSDTGYLADGSICTKCWKKFKEQKNGKTKT